MNRILHLSDIHLGKPDDHQWLDEHKGTMAFGDRRAQKHVLIETLDSFADSDTASEIEAVVVSGDLTNRAKADGFDEFAALAKTLTKLVSPENVMVVPGNHDVPQDHGPDDPPARYAKFLHATRELGFATPLLDGIDFDADGHLLDAHDKYPHLIQGERFVLLPINTSHFCWGSEPLPEKVIEALLASPDRDEADKAAKQLRLHDVPRVSNAQITAIGELLSGIGLNSQLRLHDRVNVAVLHHQLLPVSAREEFKRFESLTNLGAVREFLVSLGIDVVLHGHKHESALYWDYVANAESLATPPSRLLVAAAPGTFRPGQPVARSLTLGLRRSAADVLIEDICAATSRGGENRHQTVGRARLWDSPELSARADARVVRGTTASDVYARVQSIFDAVADDEPLRYLVCEIEDQSSAGKIPDDYARDGDANELQAWMDDLVEWWQLHDPQLDDGVFFNHGERIYKRWGNQVKRAGQVLSDALKHDPETTRAAILLLDPRTEPSADGEFPSFVSIQLQLVKVSSSSWRLDCTGLFRKQEMRYWWPINVAELADVQVAVAAAVTIDEGHPDCGVLRTVTAYAIAEERLPVVAVPAVDRAVDQSPGDLWRMAYSLLEPGKANTDIRAIWQRYLDDLRPPDAIDKTPALSRRGLRRVLDSVSAVDPGGSRPAVSALRKLIRTYQLVGDPRSSDREELRETVRELLETLDRELDDLFGSSATAGGS